LFLRIAIPVAVVTVESVGAYLAGDYLLVLQNVPLIKQVAHTQEAGLSQMVVTMFYDQGLLVEQFARVIPATSATVSNFTGVR
jgi:hypothetical protein|tara:strand:- start:296 stop:544 length:249 start_codon:yes stop_codon:yes gene_type:complete